MPKKSLQQLMANWKVASNKMQKFQQDLPMVMGEESVKIIKDNFKQQRYDSGNGIENWQQRSAKTNKRYDSRSGVKGTTFKSNSPLLRQTLTLYNSLMFRVTGKSVFVGTNTSLVPYAPAHNEGTKNGIPKRKFIPANGELPNQKIIQKISKKIISVRNEIMKDFKK
jgi:phage gpG-like protein